MLTDVFSPQGTYLDSATYGLCPQSALAAFQRVTHDWATGVYCPTECDAVIERSRGAFARIHGVAVGDVAIGHQVSELVAPVAASLPRGAQVVVAAGEFTSLTFPFLAAGCTVREVPLERLAESLDDADLVAVSAVQSADGRLADLSAISRAAVQAGALTLVDVTQASGWLELDAGRLDLLVTGGYKWLCQPRGTAYLAVRPALRDRIRPLNAGWFAGADPWQSCYGLPLRAAANARRFDVSPAWLNWHAAACSLELIEQIGVGAIGAHNITLANRLRQGLGLGASDSAIVSFAAGQDASERLAKAGVRGSVRAGRVRLSCHFYNSEADVDQALAALQPQAAWLTADCTSPL